MSLLTYLNPGWSLLYGFDRIHDIKSGNPHKLLQVNTSQCFETAKLAEDRTRPPMALNTVMDFV